MDPEENSKTQRMPAHVEEAVRSISLLHARHQEKATPAQRHVEHVTNLAGSPVFLGIVICAVAGWVLANVLLPLAGWHAFDSPPFAWLQFVLTLAALLVAIFILV